MANLCEVLGFWVASDTASAQLLNINFRKILNAQGKIKSYVDYDRLQSPCTIVWQELKDVTTMILYEMNPSKLLAATRSVDTTS